MRSGSFLGDKHDLGLHTEMISDGVLPLLENGNINGKRKQRDIGKVSVTFLMGTRKLYDFVDNNPIINMLPVDVCNNPAVIAENDNVVSINSCVEVDLQGQVCAEAIGLRQISGIGGQMDFVRGANLSKGGRSIIALHSTTKDESASKIVTTITTGGPCHHQPLRCQLYCHRVRRGAASRSNAPRARKASDCHCASQIP